MYDPPVNAYFGANRLAPFATAARGVVVGTHDGARATVHMGALDDQVVFHHEYGHEVLFGRTIDGGLLAVLWQAIDRPTGLAKERLSDLTTTAETLVARSRFAHEVFATYYGIKMVDPASGLAALPLLPVEYRNYFKAAASVIDPHFRSTFLQVRVALTLSCIAFESRLTLRFLRRPWAAWKKVRRDEQPDWRIRTLLRRLEAGGARDLRTAVDHWVAAFFAQRGTAPWNVDEEEAWSVHAVEGNQLDVYLDKHVADWINELGAVPVLSDSERTACFDHLKRFATEAGIKLDVIQTAAPGDASAVPGLDPTLEHFRQDKAARLHALRQAASHVANRPLGLTLPRVPESELWQHDLYRQADGFVVVGPDPSSASVPWTVVRFGPKGTPTNIKLNGVAAHAVHVAAGDLVAWLNGIVDDGQAHWPGKLPQTIVVPFGRSADAGGQAFSFEGEEPTGNRLGVAYNDRIAMYVVGNWVDFVQRAAGFGPVALTELHADITGYDGAPQPLTIKIATCEKLPGRLHMRALGRNAAAAVDLLELDWRNNESIRVLSTEEAENEGLDLQFVGNAMNGILAFWSRF